MAAFRFAAADASGKEQSGVLEADSARLARQLLRGRGLIPLSVEPVSHQASGRGRGGLSIGRRLGQTELAVITRQLASLLGAQLPVADALTVMVEQSEKQQVRELMASIRTDVLGGSSLSDALARHPRQFPEIYRALTEHLGVHFVWADQEVIAGSETALMEVKSSMGVIVAMKTFDQTRPGIAAQGVGLAQGALDAAVEYARERETFGKPIIAHQAVQHMLADMATEIEAARALTYLSARTADRRSKDLPKVSAMSKLFATDVAMKVTTDVVQIFGGYGYMRDYPVEKMMRDAKITQIYEGTNQVIRNAIALEVLKRKAKQE